MFKTELINRIPFATANKRILYLPLVFISKYSLEPIIAPKDFPYDGASTPKFTHRLFPKFGEKYDYAVVIHDFLCKEANKHLGTPQYAIKRKFADDVFLEIMELSGVSWWRRKAMYRAVRMSGKITEWRN